MRRQNLCYLAMNVKRLLDGVNYFSTFVQTITRHHFAPFKFAEMFKYVSKMDSAQGR